MCLPLPLQVQTLKGELAAEQELHAVTAQKLKDTQGELERTAENARVLHENNIRLSAQNDEHERSRDVLLAHLEAEKGKGSLHGEQSDMLREQVSEGWSIFCLVVHSNQNIYIRRAFR